ncbi:MAG: protoheme IX farnesyltransferase [Ignavibacteriales bacterium]|nr:MAG: protoheme IX farnesyltransferase [Ignavibacteriales bacterium]
MSNYFETVKNKINPFLELAKIRITFFVAISTAVGFIQFAGELSARIILPSIGVLILACGSSAINHYQEINTDALMDRTRNRPLASGKISPIAGLTFAIVLIIIGSASIYFSSGYVPLILGWITLLWYNLFYTPLKKRYALAVVPGSIVGALPPVIGWVAAGGYLWDAQALALALFFFIWQIPHFWLLLLIYGEDYEKAGFPTLTKIFSDAQLSRITYMWIIALAISSLLIPLFSFNANIITAVLLLVAGFWLVYKSINVIKDYLNKRVFRKAFLLINVYVLIVVIIISVDKLIFRQL